MAEDPESKNASLLRNLPFRGFLFVCVTYTFVIVNACQTYQDNWEYGDFIAPDEKAAYVISVFGILLSLWDFMRVHGNKTTRRVVIAWGIMSLLLGPFFWLLDLWLLHRPGFIFVY